MRRGTVLFVLGLAGALLLPAGCTSDPAPAPAPTTSRSSAPSPTPDAAKVKTELVEALERLRANPFRYAVDGSIPDAKRVKATGAVDQKTRRFQSSVTVTGGADPVSGNNIVVGNECYVREAGKGWVHVDLERVKPGHPFVTFEWADPTGLKAFTSAIVSVKRTAARTYTGRFDPASSLRDAFLPVGAPSMITLGISLSPFTVTTDDKGWVVSIAVEITPTRGETLKMTTKMSAHGKALSVKAPARAAEADDLIYR